MLAIFGNLKVFDPSDEKTYISKRRKKRSAPPGNFGETYDPDTSCTFDTKNEAKMFHSLLKKVGESFNSHVSLYDIPKLYNPMMPPKPPNKTYEINYHNHAHLPTYTLCEIDPEKLVPFRNEELCRSIWNNVTNSYESADEMNPYLITDEKVSLCGSGLGQVIG